MTTPAAVNALLEPFLACINDHSGASTSSFEFSAQILASVPKLAAGGTGLSQILMNLAHPGRPSSAFAPVLRFLGPDILTRMGFSPVKQNLFICYAGMKFYVAEVAKAGLRAFTDPGPMCAALASDPATLQQAFDTNGPFPSFRGDDFTRHLDPLLQVFQDLAQSQEITTEGTLHSLPAGLLLQDLRADLQATLFVRYSIGQPMAESMAFVFVQCITAYGLRLTRKTCYDTFRPPFFSDPAAATRAAGVLKNLDGKLMDVCSSLFMRNHKPEGPVSVARIGWDARKHLCFSLPITKIVARAWMAAVALTASGTPVLMAFVMQSGAVALCLAEAQEVATRFSMSTTSWGRIPADMNVMFAITLKDRLDPLTDFYLETGDTPLLFMLRQPQGGPGVARTLLILARLARRCLNFTLPHINTRTAPLGPPAIDCVGRVSGFTLRLFRYGAISAHDAAIVIAELVRPAAAIPIETMAAYTGTEQSLIGSVTLPSICFELSHVICLAARDPAALLMLRRALGAITIRSSGVKADREYATAFCLLMDMDFHVPALSGWGALALGETNHMSQVRRHFTPKRIAGLIGDAGKSQRPGPHESNVKTRAQSSLFVGLAAILQDYMLGPGIEGAGGRCWDIWGREGVNLGPLLDAIALGPVPHVSVPLHMFGFGTLIYQPYFEVLAVIGKTLHLARRAALGRIRAGLLGPEAERRVEKLDQWRQRAREINRRFLFDLLPEAEEEDNVRRMGARDASRVAPLEDLLRELDAVDEGMKV